MRGEIARIQRFSTTNGPGLRSTVFLKGCPLDCLWCHNPEMRIFGPALLYYPAQCLHCGACAAACPQKAHAVSAQAHSLDRSRCVNCGRCAQVCPCDALERLGETLDAEEVVRRLCRDRRFYETSGGGITLSGGEPLAQFDFTQAILRGFKAEGLHTCLDTSGWGGRAADLVPLVDLFLWDIKETDPASHLAATGVALPPILDSLRRIDDAGAKLWLRCPIIPGVNNREDHIAKIGKLAQSLQGLLSIDLVPYHALGLVKAEAVGKSQQDFPSVTDQEKADFLALLQSLTTKPAQWL